ncbi:MAG TPA: hypothetical protein PLD92_03465 [Candidatus Omnitrophota bacterium]|nr:hypothetical protein [Candidatus Omnitrophota bacterium]
MLNRLYRFFKLLGMGLMSVVFLSLPHLDASAAETGTTAIQVSLKTFDEDVAQSRRQMRAYCAIAQELMTAKAPDSAKQEAAVKYLKEAQVLWDVVRQKYQDAPPVEYSRDAKFKVRLAEISEAMDDMLIHLEAGRAKRSFQSCGFACGLFVSMHEENDLVYALDRLFHLRKVIKAASAVNKNVGLEGIQKMLPDLLQKRDAVFMAPCPWPYDANRCQEYVAALKNLSANLDDFSIAVINRDSEAAAKVLNGLLELCNTAYSLAL